MNPVSTNATSKNCPDPLGSDCVTFSQDAAILGLCKGASLTDILSRLITLIQSLGGEEATDYQNLLNALNAALDLSSIDLGCLYPPTTDVWTCPFGQIFVPGPLTPVADGGTGIPGVCAIRVPGGGFADTPNLPFLTSTPNPVPKPTTLPGILQLMISKIPCCDPCNTTKGQ